MVVMIQSNDDGGEQASCSHLGVRVDIVAGVEGGGEHRTKLNQVIVIIIIGIIIVIIIAIVVRIFGFIISLLLEVILEQERQGRG